jgi:hypothetical protein
VAATSRRSREASFNGADGVVQNGTLSKECILKHFGNPYHPVCAAVMASHLFLDGAATPPVSGGEFPAWHSFTFIERAYDLEDFIFTARVDDYVRQPPEVTAANPHEIAQTFTMRARPCLKTPD